MMFKITGWRGNAGATDTIEGPLTPEQLARDKHWELVAAFDLGQEAFEVGNPVSYCPFSRAELAEEWKRGFTSKGVGDAKT